MNWYKYRLPWVNLKVTIVVWNIFNTNPRLTISGILFHRRTRASYVYNGCLAWYNVVLTPRVHSSLQYRCKFVGLPLATCATVEWVLYNCLSWYKFVNTHLYHCRQLYNIHIEHNSAFTLKRMSLDNLLHMRLKTLLATLFNGSVHTSHMWSDLASDMRHVERFAS